MIPAGKGWNTPISDEFDALLAERDGWGAEELDLVINYDIKYRMGDELEGSEDQRMSGPPEKHEEHQSLPGEQEITRFELLRVLDGDVEWMQAQEELIICLCPPVIKRLIAYRVFVNHQYDVVLRGVCSGCKTDATRYVEIGEDSEVERRIKKVLKERGCG